MKTFKMFMAMFVVSLLLPLANANADFGPCNFDSDDPWKDEDTYTVDLPCGLSADVAFYYRIAEGYFRDIYTGDVQLKVKTGSDPDTYRDASFSEIEECMKYYANMLEGSGENLDIAWLKEEVIRNFLAEFLLPEIPDNAPNGAFGLKDGETGEYVYKSPVEKMMKELWGEEYAAKWGISREYGCEQTYRIGSSACVKSSWSIDPGNLFKIDGSIIGVFDIVDIPILIDEYHWQTPFIKKWPVDKPLAIQQNWILDCNAFACCLETWEFCVKPNPQDRLNPLLEWNLLSKTLSNTYSTCDHNNLTNPHCMPVCD